MPSPTKLRASDDLSAFRARPARPTTAKPLAELIKGALGPVVSKRGLARTEILSWWPDIIGQTYAELCAPERIRWPRSSGAAVLIIRCDPTIALPLSYEVDGIRDRLNGFLGFPAIGTVRLVQAPFDRQRKTEKPAEPDEAAMAELEARLAGCDDGLKAALLKLGRLVLTQSLD